MPVQLTYPGVYIEEIPSGVRTITGVATSITAFIGRALRGPVNEPITITSLADFERIFGGLWVESSLGYSVRDFYLNGGNQAIIVRIFNPLDDDVAQAADAVASAAVKSLEGSSDSQTLTDLQVTNIKNAIDGVINNLTDPAVRDLIEKFKTSITPSIVNTNTVGKFKADVVTANESIDKIKARLNVNGVSNDGQISALNDAADAVKAAIQSLADNSQLGPGDVTAITNALSSAPDSLKNDTGLKDVIAVGKTAGDVRTTLDQTVNKIISNGNLDLNALNTAANAVKKVIQNMRDGDLISDPNITDINAAINAVQGIPQDFKNDMQAAIAAGKKASDVRNAVDNAVDNVISSSVAAASTGSNVLKLKAASEGSWGMNLRARVTYPDPGTAQEIADGLGVLPSDLFNLSIQDSATGVIEGFRNVTVVKSSRRVDKVLENGSNLVLFDGDTSQDTLGSGTRPNAHPSPGTGKGVWDENIPPTYNEVLGTVTDGKQLKPGNLIGTNNIDKQHGLYALKKADLFNILCVPPFNRDGDAWIPSDTVYGVYSEAMDLCAARRAMLIVDPPTDWSANKETAVSNTIKGLSDLGLAGTSARNAALFFPRVLESDLLRSGRPEYFAPSGMIAGIWARTDVQRGVWKAPAGLDASLNGILGLEVVLNDDENGRLNPLGINCLRDFKVLGRVVWGARTMRGADQLADEWKYIPVRRTALFIEESLFRGTQWIVFEPNDEPLWAQIRLNVGAFMHSLFIQGAFQGTTPRDAYFVKCDKETTTQDDINKGIVNIRVGFAPLKPAEFVVIQIQQMAGQIQT